MPRLRLTDLAIKALAPIEGRAVTYWDDLSPLGMRVAPGGTKTFIVLVGSGKRRKLGRYPHLTLLKARERAKNHLAELSSGASPLRIEDALDRYIENHCRKNTKASSAAEMERLLRKHILPKFRRKYLADIGPTDVAELIDDLLRTPGTANGVFRAMRAFFNWTVRRNYLTRSPCYGMQLPSRPAARERVLTDEELKAIWKVAIQYGWPFGTIVRLLLLTGQRRHEVASLRRSWIGDQCITLPASVTKNGRTHTWRSPETGVMDRSMIPWRE